MRPAIVAPLTTESIVSRSGNLVSGEVDGEIVALDIARGHCYGLNRVASRIWALTATPTSVAGICSALVRDFEVDQAACESDVLLFLEEFLAEKLITVQEPALSAAT